MHLNATGQDRMHAYSNPISNWFSSEAITAWNEEYAHIRDCITQQMVLFSSMLRSLDIDDCVFASTRVFADVSSSDVVAQHA